MPAIDPLNPLCDLHRQAEAEFQSYGGLEIVSTFGEPQAEYGAIRARCGLMDLPQRGVIELTGNDRLVFLNNLLSNQTWDKQTKSGLAPGATIYAYLLHAKSGKILSDLTVIELGGRTLLDLDRRLVAGVLKTLERYHFSEAVELRDRSDELHQIALHGPAAAEIVGAIEPSSVRWRDDACGVPGFNVLLPPEQARATWMRLLTGGDEKNRPPRPVGWAAFNTARIEAGRAMFGIDFDETFLPAETGPIQMSRAVSFTKGCYPGQEIVARMHARQQVARQLVGFRVTSAALPIAGTQVFDEDQGNVVGAVTSSTISPILSGAAIGIAILKRTHVAPGSKLCIGAEGAIHSAHVVELPFLKEASKITS